jgi:hypothetical protein
MKFGGWNKVRNKRESPKVAGPIKMCIKFVHSSHIFTYCIYTAQNVNNNKVIGKHTVWYGISCACIVTIKY